MTPTPVKTHKGYLLGARIPEWEIYGWCLDAWQNPINAMIATAVCLSESAGREKARCENFIDGKLVAIDFGLMQLDYDVKDITADLLKKLYDGRTNIRMAHELWLARGRSFKPWHGFGDNIALNPEMRGKYIQRAIWAQMNYERRCYGMKGVPSPYALGGAKRLTWWIEHPDLKS